MTINTILSGKKDARDFYTELRGTTIQEAAKEPLKLSDLRRRDGKFCAPKQPLPSGLVVSYAGALCYYCLESLLKCYSQRTKPETKDLEYMAGQMVRNYPDWTVLDLPTFVDMCMGSRIPTPRLGQMEYRLVVLDIPNIMDKVEAYDKMRPNPQALQGGSPEKAVEKELTYWQKTHLLDGTPYEWEDLDECKRYWKESPGKDDPELQAIQASIDAQTKGGICNSVNDVLRSVKS